MSPESVFKVALERLQTHGRVPHSHLLHMADFDEELMRVVSDRLIRAGHAVDNYGIELVLVDTLGASTGVQVAEATDRQVATGNASDAPHTPSRTAGADRRNTSSSMDGKSTGLPRYMLWEAGCETGPFPREELEQRLVEGRLQPNEFVRIESHDE